jgi:hypothetical protein
MNSLSMVTIKKTSDTYLSSLDEQNEFYLLCGLALYTVFIAPKLNKRVIDMISHPLSKLALIFIIVLLSVKSPVMGILMAIAILVTFSSAEKELMTSVSGSGSTVKGDCKCVSWECDEADGGTMSFDSDMDDAMLPGHDPSGMIHHPASPEEHLHAQEAAHESAPEDPAVHVIVEEKAKMEQQLQRPLSKTELHTLCANVNESMKQPATSAPVESFSDMGVVGYSGSTYASI